MNSKELRQGNIIEHKYAPYGGGTEPTWDWNYVQVSDLDGMDKYPDNFRPIQLTTEWLVKFGFEKRSIKWTDGSVSEDVFVKFRYVLKFTKDGIVLSRFMTVGIPKIEPIYIASPEKVHELQNLWFCLTGEELTVNG